jgi:hypothetical protein
MGSDKGVRWRCSKHFALYTIYKQTKFRADLWKQKDKIWLWKAYLKKNIGECCEFILATWIEDD